MAVHDTVMHFFRKAPADKPPSIRDRVEAAMCQRKRVLFVEDNDILRDFVQKLVEPQFCVEIVSVGSVAAARRRLEEGEFAAAILDYRLTNGLGLDLYNAIIRRWPSLQVVFLSAFAGDELAAKVEAIGPARVYSKDAIGNPQFLTLLFEQMGVRRLSRAVAEPVAT